MKGQGEKIELGIYIPKAESTSEYGSIVAADSKVNVVSNEPNADYAHEELNAEV